MLENENLRVEEKDQEVDSNLDYIDAIKDLKANTVEKAQYEKLKEENKKLLNSLINGETIESGETPTKPDVNEIRKDLFDGSKDISNLDYITNVLKLRNALLEEGKSDPFLPFGHNVAPTAQDVEAATRVADVLQNCVDYADGDSALFTAELQRVMIDAAPAKAKRK